MSERLTEAERVAIVGPGGTHDWEAALSAVEAVIAARLAPVRALADQYATSENWRIWGVPQSIRAALGDPR